MRPRGLSFLPQLLGVVAVRQAAGVYYGRHHEVLSERDKTKQLTMQRRKKEYRAARAA